MGIFYIMGFIVAFGLCMGLGFSGFFGEIDDSEKCPVIFLLSAICGLLSWVAVVGTFIAVKVENDKKAFRQSGGRYMIPLNKITKEKIESLIRGASPRASIFYEDLDVISDAIVTHYKNQKVEYEEEDFKSEETIKESPRAGFTRL